MHKLTRFLLSMLKIGFIGFGGGSALIPVMEKEFIGEGKTDTKENFDKDILIANLTPGALTVKLATALGRRGFGWKGMLLGAAAQSLPGTVLTILLLTALAQIRDDIGILMELLTIAVSIFIIYLIALYIRRVCRQTRSVGPVFFRRALLVMLGVFLLSCGKNVYRLAGIDGTPPVCLSTFHILAFSLVAIILVNIVRGLRSSRSKAPGRTTARTLLFSDRGCLLNIKKDVTAWSLFFAVCSLPALFLCLQDLHVFLHYLSFSVRGAASVLTSFGGGDAYLATADGLFVESGLISQQLFYGEVVPVANLLPGSFLAKALTAIGYCYGVSLGTAATGLAFALGGYICGTGISSLVFLTFCHLYDTFSGFRSAQTISHYIGPIVCGLLGTVILALINLCRETLLSLSAFL